MAVILKFKRQILSASDIFKVVNAGEERGEAVGGKLVEIGVDETVLVHPVALNTTKQWRLIISSTQTHQAASYNKS